MVKRLIALLAVSLLLIPYTAFAGSDDQISILLIGTDNLGYAQPTGTADTSRADAIFLATFNGETGSVKLLSIERDYLVTLPGDLGENKLGISTFFGGPEMCLEVVNGLLDLNVSLYAHIDIANMISAVDIIGGIELDILEEEVDDVNAFIAGIPPFNTVPGVVAGVNQLGGLQTWAFLAIRDMTEENAVGSNEERNSRQKRVLLSCMEKAASLDITEAMDLLSVLLPLVKTNLTTRDLLSLTNLLLVSDMESISYFHTPNGPYRLKRINMHRVIISQDMRQEVAMVHEFLGRQ